MPSRSVFYKFRALGPMGFRVFFLSTARLKILYCNPHLKKVLYKQLFALILKLHGKIRHTILKTWVTKSKNLETPWGLVLETWKWYQNDREVISYHYHSKLGEVTVFPYAQGFKKKNSGFTLTCTILVAQLFVLSVRLSTPGHHPKTFGFDVAEGRI